MAELENNTPPSTLPLSHALLPVVVMIGLLVFALTQFGDDTIGGPAQLALLLAGCVAAGVGVRHGKPWWQLEQAAAKSLAQVSTTILILLSIGGLIGVWMAAGIIPTLIHYGSQILNPSIFYLAALCISAVVALVVGSSWTTAGTVGVALIGVAAASGLSLPMTAGAIISGVYFGDKLSPLSDTTNLAAGLAGTQLFTHVRYLLWTTLPAFIIAAVFFGIVSLNAGAAANSEGLAQLEAVMQSEFTLSWVLLLPFIAIFALAMSGVPALIAIVLSIIIGAVFGIAVQDYSHISMAAIIAQYWQVAANGFTLESGNALADDLLSRGGMSSMLSTVWLIITAMFFSGMMESSGCLQRLLSAILHLFQRKGAILYGVGATSLATNVVAADQYLSLVLSSRMYAGEIEQRGLKPETLSRTIEDFGTVTSPLIPWNTCGAFMAAALGVPTLVYLPYCIFNLCSPLVSLYYISTGKTLRWQSNT